MYDTLHFWLDRVEAGDIPQASTLNLSNAKETVNRDTGEIWTVGNLDNLKVTVSGAGVSVKGSLAKFLLPDNTFTLTRQQSKEAIEKLSDGLSLNLSKAKVTRIDVSTNFIMQHEVKRYYDVLGLCTHFNRVQATNNTLYYHNNGKEQKKAMIFYNKAREVSARNGIIPDVYDNANLLRYESRWHTRLPQQLKVPEVRGCTLSDRQFYSKLVRLWGDAYFKIEKKKQITPKAMEHIKTVSDATDYICAFALQKLPADEVQNILEDLKGRKVFKDRTSYTRLKKKLKDIQSKTDITEVDTLVKELDNGVRNVLAYKR